ncbi:MAG: hypothetical protein ACYCT9_03055 [Leptospirillum sp.]|jgi:hypothetical protein
MNSFPIKRVKEETLRDLFNNAQIETRVASGEVFVTVKKERHPSSPKKNLPYCTRSQFVIYWDQSGIELARAHRYLKPDGSIGASGKADPKRMLHQGIILIADSG